MKKKIINVVTLGCSKNIVDSEHLMAQLRRNNFEITFDSNTTDAKIVVVNTCGFIGDAKEESVNTILGFASAKSAGEIDHLFVMGCLAERYKKELEQEIPEVDRYFGVNNLADIVEAVGGRYRDELTGERPPDHTAPLRLSQNIRGLQLGVRVLRDPADPGPTRLGADGTARRRSGGIGHSGVKELIVIAQDTTYYGLDLYGERRLGDLLRRLCRIDGIEWLSFTMPIRPIPR